ncbi:MAG TPA: hypothetical protein VEZ40_02570 [Pyrinomonadaceae bacterium]|nr:hypothetical protein [Pyrinomonadaceae bacterium]
MTCPSCGIALPLQLKYCNRCGAQLTTAKETELVAIYEKRMESEMEGLFWITVFGLGLLLGGLVVLKKSLDLGEGLLLAYALLCSTALAAYFGLGVWQIRRLARSSKEAARTLQPGQVETNELPPFKTPATLEPALSVAEHTTRTLEPEPARRKTGAESAF